MSSPQSPYASNVNRQGVVAEADRHRPQALDADREMAARLRSGDRSAFRELFEREGVKLVALTTRLVRDAGMAEEVVQDVFATLWCRPHLYEPERGGLSNWLLMRCRGLAIDRVRSQVARNRREEFVVRGNVSAHLDDYDFGDCVNVERALAALSIADRDLVGLTFYRGLSYRAAAALLGIPEGTAKSRMRRLLIVLRGRLGAPTTDEPASAEVHCFCNYRRAARDATSIPTVASSGRPLVRADVIPTGTK